MLQMPTGFVRLAHLSRLARPGAGAFAGVAVAPSALEALLLGRDC